MTVEDFLILYPHLRMDPHKAMKLQYRITVPELLAKLPPVLEPSYPTGPTGRNRINPNQTLSHKQCAACGQVKRNDFFYAPPSLAARNLLHPYCIECTKAKAIMRYKAEQDFLSHRYAFVWAYLAPACAVCGFDDFPPIIEMHGEHETTLRKRVAEFAQEPDGHKAEGLIRLAKAHIPLCPNCHRLLHANLLPPLSYDPPSYRIMDLIRID